MQINKIKQIAVAVNDLDESIAFYQNILGANFVAKYDPPGLGFLILRVSGYCLKKVLRRERFISGSMTLIRPMKRYRTRVLTSIRHRT
jgi:catechol 2,3-dioxygenase-like lactoylglutathione lyase family enzyme